MEYKYTIGKGSTSTTAGALVETNVSETATDILNNLKINTTVFDIPGAVTLELTEYPLTSGSISLDDIQIALFSKYPKFLILKILQDNLVTSYNCGILVDITSEKLIYIFPSKEQTQKVQTIKGIIDIKQKTFSISEVFITVPKIMIGEEDIQSLTFSSDPQIQLDNCAKINQAQIFTGLQQFTNGATISDTLTVNGDIVQNGNSYITHAEEVYTKKDHIILREGAVGALTENAGFKILNYDGTNTGVIVLDSTGTLKIGDLGDEQPVATREESPINGGFAKWDEVSKKFITTTDIGISSDEITKLKALLGLISVSENTVKFNGTVEANVFNDVD